MRLYIEKEIGAILKRTAKLSKDSNVENQDESGEATTERELY